MPSALQYVALGQSALDRLFNIVRIAPVSGNGPIFQTRPDRVTEVLSYLSIDVDLSAFNVVAADKSISQKTINIIFIDDPKSLSLGHYSYAYSLDNISVNDTIIINPAGIDKYSNSVGASGPLQITSERAAVFAHEFLHAKYGPHAWNDNTPITLNLVLNDKMYQAEAGLMGQLQIAANANAASLSILSQSGKLDQVIASLPEGALVVSDASSNLSKYSVAVDETGLSYYNVDILNKGTYKVYVIDSADYSLVRAANVVNSVQIKSNSAREDLAVTQEDFLVDPLGNQTAGNALAVAFNNEISNSSLVPLGQIVGASIGQYLAGTNKTQAVVYSSLLGVIGHDFAALISTGGNFSTVFGKSTHDALQSFGSQFGDALEHATSGTVSGMLATELGNLLGLKGFGAELFSTAVSPLITSSIDPVVKLVSSNITSGTAQFLGFDYSNAGTSIEKNIPNPPISPATLVENAVGAYLGSKLGALVYSPQTEAGQALATLGSAVGSWALSSTAVGGLGLISSSNLLISNLLLPGIGAFVGFILGAIIGDLFGSSKPRIPSASSQAILQIPYAHYQVGQLTSANGGTTFEVQQIAQAAANTLNGIFAQIAGNPTPLFVANTSSPTQVYGYTGNQLWLQEGGTSASKINVNSADQAVDKGVLWALPQTQVIGGDFFLKRALQTTQAVTVAAVLGDLQVASDFSFYEKNTALINGYITQAYNTLTQTQQNFYTANKALIDQVDTQGVTSLSASQLAIYNANQSDITTIVTALQAQTIANPWIITLQRASELGLQNWSKSDIFGGLGGFLQSLGIDGRGAINLADISLTFDGMNLTVALPSAVGAGAFSILPQASSDGSSVAIAGFLSAMGYSAWSGSATGAQSIASFKGRTTALSLSLVASNPGGGPQGVPFYDNNSIVIGGDGGNYIIGGAGYGWLQGGAGLNYIQGGLGHDILVGSSGNSELVAGPSGSVLVGGSGGAYATGQTVKIAGNSITYFGGLVGGSGNDTFIPGTGLVTATGGDGNDLYLAYDNNQANTFDGGSGSNTVSFQRLTHGVNVNLSNVSNGVFGASTVILPGVTATNVQNLIGTNYTDVLETGLSGGVLEGGAGADQLIGGGGVTTVSYEHSNSGVYVNLATGQALGGDASGDTFTRVQNIIGSNYADQLQGIYGSTLSGLNGDDTYLYSGGNNSYIGGSGFNTVDYSTATGALNVDLSAGYGSAYVGGNAGTNDFYTNISKIIGSPFGSTIRGNSANSPQGTTFVSMGGTNTFTGSGADNIYLTRGGGVVSVDDPFSQNAEITVGAGITFDNLWIAGQGGDGTTGFFDLGVSGTGDKIRMLHNNKYHKGTSTSVLKTINMNGASQLDVGQLNFGVGGTGQDGQVINSSAGYNTLIFGYGGNSTINVGAGRFTSNSAVIVAGATHNGGTTTINLSGGDDQIAYERGDGHYVIQGIKGGNKTIVFGSTVAASDVIYEIVGNDLYIGLQDPTNTQKTASQVADNIEVVGGGLERTNSLAGTSIFNTIRYVQVGGSSIDLQTLSLPWVVADSSFVPGGVNAYWWTHPIGSEVINSGFRTANSLQALSVQSLASVAVTAVSKQPGLILSKNTPADVVLTRYGASNDLYVFIASTGDVVQLKDQFNPAGGGVQYIKFSDKSTVTASQIFQNLLSQEGAASSNAIYGAGNYNGVISAGTGDKYINGEGGAVTYSYGPTGGNDTIDDPGLSSTLQFVGIKSTDVVFERFGASSDLQVYVKTTGKTITIRNQFSGSNGALASISFSDGVSLNGATQIDQRATNDQISSGQSAIDGFGGVGLTVTTGVGNKAFLGFSGATTYNYSASSGNDIIWDGGRSSTLNFTDLQSTDVTLSRFGSSTDLIITVVKTGKTLKVTNEFSYYDAGTLGTIKFADGVSWTDAQVRQNVVASGTASTSGTIFGYYGFGATIAAGAGNKDLNAGSGPANFQYSSSGGNDIIENTSNASTLTFTDIKSTDVTLSRVGSGNGLLITVIKTGKTVNLVNEFDYLGGGALATIGFSDGVSWTDAQLRQNVLTQASSTGAGSIYGYYGWGATVAAGTGNRDLNSNAGPANFQYSSSGGNDIVENFSNSSTLTFTDIKSTDVTLSRVGSGNGLLITVTKTGKTVNLVNEFSYFGGGALATVKFSDGVTWTDTQVRQNTITQSASATTGSVYGYYGWGATIAAGVGNKYLNGGGGPTTYQYASTGGNDIIDDPQNVSNVAFTDLKSTDVAFTRDGASNDLIISIAKTGKTVTVLNEFNSNGGTLSFSDGVKWALQDVLTRTTAAKVVAGTAGNDVLTAGVGNQILRGGGGADTYKYASTGGNDIIDDGGSASKLVLSNIASTGVTLYRFDASNDLEILINATGKTLTLKGQFYADAINRETSALQSITFSDGVTWTSAQIKQQLLTQATATNAKSIYGFTNGGDVLVAGRGDEYLSGHGGADTYKYASTGGNDIIDDGGSSSKLVFTDIASTGVSLYRFDASDDLQILIKATGKTLTLKGQFYADAINRETAALQSVTFSDGVTWTSAQIKQQLLTQATTTNAKSIYGFTNSGDVLVAGKGDEYLSGHGGADTYKYASAGGNDIINDGGSSSTLVFTDIASTGVSLYRFGSSDDLQILIKATGKTVTLKGQFYADAIARNTAALQSITFSDGVTWSKTQLKQLLLTQATAANAKSIYGFSNGGYGYSTGDDVLVAGKGDEYLNGLGGADTYKYAAAGGNDIIDDGGSSSTLVFTDIASTGVSLTRADGSNDLQVTINATGKTLTIKGQFGGGGALSSFVFSDGVTWTNAQITQQLLKQENAGPTKLIYATSGNDAITLGPGDKYAYGAGGSDTYIYSSTGGNDVIGDPGAYQSTLQFSDLKSTDVALSRPGLSNNLLISVAKTGKAVTVQGQFSPNGVGALSSLTFADGVAWSASQINQKFLAAETAATSGAIYGYSTNDTLVAGLGNKYLNGGGGADIYQYASTGGNDVIDDGGSQSQLVLTDIASTGVSLSRVLNGNDLQITIGSTKKVITVVSQFAPSGAGTLQSITFSDHVTWNAATIQAATNTVAATPIASSAIKPLVFDLNGDGLELNSVSTSDVVSKDYNGVITRLGWVGPTNGVLVKAPTGTGPVNTIANISFVGNVPGATSDLQGLTSFDTNGDGQITNTDTGWTQLNMWVDANQDGIAETGELKSLTQLGITSISLTAQATGFDGSDATDNYVVNTTTFTYADGTTSTAYDVALARQFLGQTGIDQPKSISWADLQTAGVIGQLLVDPATVSGNNPATQTYAAFTAKGTYNFSNSGTISAQDAARWAAYLVPALIAQRKAQEQAGFAGTGGPPTAKAAALLASTANRGAKIPLTRLQALVLSSDGVSPQLVSLSGSSVTANVGLTGTQYAIGWVGPKNGILVDDALGDGKIDIATQANFQSLQPAAATSLAALSVYDSNHDGVVDTNDQNFGQLKIWVDANQNGVSDTGELRSLADLGVKSFKLAPTSTNPDDKNLGSNEILATAQVNFVDGHTATLNDVALAVKDPSAPATATPAVSATPTAASLATPIAPQQASVIAAASLSPTALTTSQNAGLAASVSGSRGNQDGPTSDVVGADVFSVAQTNWWQSQPSTVASAFGPNVSTAQSPSITGATGSASTSAIDAASLQQQQLLRQSVTAFQADAGSAPALWNRSGSADLLSTLTAAAKPSTPVNATAPAKSLVGVG